MTGIQPSAPISPPMESTGNRLLALELKDGTVLEGYSFGAQVPSAGELVFQTGMVGYPESITDPSYEGQILVITFPLVGNYGVPDRELRDEDVAELPKYFESHKIHVAGLVIAHYTEEFSHFLAKSSLGAWLKEQNIPAMYGVDTRALTKHLRQSGSMLGRIAVQTDNATVEEASSTNWTKHFEIPEWDDPNVKNLVAKVSTPKPVLYTPNAETPLVKGPDGKTLRILALDIGMKYNQIRCFVRRGVELKVVPWNHDLESEAGQYDGLFLSNGPGDPSVMESTVEQIKKVVASQNVPIFGICLGHQLLARATGASTLKLKFGNRGHNIPCVSKISGRCYITSQNHGYAVDVETLSGGWKELFVNANDGSNEGIYHDSLPFFSVQFHPESTPGPRDTEFLFDVFIKSVLEFKRTKTLKAVEFPGGLLADNLAAHPRVNPKKVLVLGSGGLSIGQAGEFDYSGSQAIKALKEEGIYTILINPNIATIQTSKGLADKVYFLPVTPEFVRKVILHEKPDAIYCTFGGQTALSVGIALKDEFESLGVKVLGTQIETVITTEDRELFARAMDEINEKTAKSHAANNVEEAIEAVRDIGYPVIVRAAYALGGLGSGFANNDKELVDLCNTAFAVSPQVLVERSMKGWKEVEYEVVRDAFDNCITVCNMENFDPLGIHTGDSIVVAPSQTLSDEDYNMLRTTAVNVIRHLGVVGECNIQYALNPFSKEYCIIEVNARLSRSSALASKATGYPLAYTAAKLGLNIPLHEVKNSVTKVTCACFEPSLDYVVVKMPRWDLKKFTRVSNLLSSSMKSVGEVMSIGRTFEEAIQKAIRSVDYQNLGFNETPSEIDIDAELQAPSDQRLFALANALYKGYSVQKCWELTNIDKWFLTKLDGLIKFGKYLESFGSIDKLTPLAIREAKQLGFEDRQIAKFVDSNEVAVRRLRKEFGIIPFVKQIDTVAAEFPCFTNYLYITYNADSHDVEFDDHGVMVLGSGVYRIGSSVEFDWCAVTAVRTLRANGTKTIMINYNPETVSTDYDEADRLYFETINLERVLDIYEIEQSSGVVISMGGQTSNNIALPLHRNNVKILGTSPEMIDSAENRFKFSRMLDQIGVDQPAWKELTSMDEAESFADAVGYPVLVRPSYVLSGAAMNTVYSKDDLASYLNQAVEVSRDYPVVITKYLENAKEIEMDAVARNGELVMHVVSEHVENAGVHSGDATLIVPPQDLDPETVKRIVVATAKIGKALNITGPYNIQFIAKNNEIKVIECNVRASRSFPFISKVVGTNMIEMATKAIMGLPITPYPVQKLPEDYCAVKVPQFSFSRLAGADPILGVEMASTGEVATFGHNKYEAYLKSLISTGFALPKKNILLSIGSYKEKIELLPSIKKLHEMGFKLFATAGTSDFINEHGIPVQYLEILNEEGEDQKSEYSLAEHLSNHLIDLYINLPSANRFRRPANYVSKGYQTRRMAVDYAVPLITNVKNAKLLIEAMARNIKLEVSNIDAQTSHRTASVPGLVNIASFVPSFDGAEDFEAVTKASLAAGFTYNQILPISTEGVAISDAQQLKEVTETFAQTGFTDYSLSFAANQENDAQVSQAANSVASLFLSFNEFSKSDVSSVSEHLASWPQNKPIITDAKSTELASLLLLATLNNHAIHVTGVSSANDLNIIKLVKSKSALVTFDVSVYSLFLSQEEYPGAAFLPTKADQSALWEELESIDAFSIGVVPSLLAKFLNKPVTAALGIADALPLLFKAVNEDKLTVEDIVLRLHTNPIKIFNLPEQESTVELDLDRSRSTLHASQIWSPFEGKLKGGVERVQFYGQTVTLEGELVVPQALGVDNSTFRKRMTSIAQDSVVLPSGPSAGSPSGVTRRARYSFSAEAGAGIPAAVSESLNTVSEAVSEGVNGAELVSSRPPRELSPPGAIATYIRGNNPFLRRSILSVNQVSRQDMHALFTVAQEMRLAVERRGVLDLLQGRLLTTVFYEPSTRTASSFDAAMQRLGGRVVNVSAESSSVVKGETLQDTIRTLSSYSDAIALRHPEVSSAEIAAKYSPVPILNAGNGAGEHPTQAFLDLFTIREELGTVNGITVTFMGDLKYGRPVHSLVKLLKLYQVRVNLVSPKELRLPEDLRAELIESGMLVSESEELTKDIIAKSDILYCTRVQKERFVSVEEYERLKDAYTVDNKILSHAKQHMAILHPLPRVSEIKEEVDFDQRAAYFRQTRYGLFVRMALLAMVIGVDF